MVVSLPIFYISRNIIEFVDSWPHVGHFLSNNLKCDNNDFRRCYLSLVKQTNK